MHDAMGPPSGLATGLAMSGVGARRASMRHIDDSTRYEIGGHYDSDSGYEQASLSDREQARAGQTEGDGEENTGSGYRVLFLAASLFEFNIDRSRKEAGYPYLTYVPGEVSTFLFFLFSVSVTSEELH